VIGLTTGRETNQRLNSLLKELAGTIPNSKIIRRGKSSLEELGRRLLDDGITHAIALYRYYGGPGRIDLFNIETSGMAPVPPSILLKSVTLRKEYGIIGRYQCNAITFEKTPTAAKRLGHVLSEILELPEVESAQNLTCSLHIRNTHKGTAELVVTSPATKRDVGPKLVISELGWGKKD
jgi:rRNA maturation protein Rpf1